MRKLLFLLSGYLPCRQIHIEDEPYLERYYIGKLFGLTFYLHRFVAPDEERSLHDHPWKHALAFVLCGHYIEQRLVHLDIGAPGCIKSTIRTVRFFNWIPGHCFHRICGSLPETWTLFIHGKRTKGWGFLFTSVTETGNGLIYDQPFDVKSSAKWHDRAQKGKDSDRVPLSTLKTWDNNEMKGESR